MLRGKKILIGVCGSIAAYKIAFLTRLLVQEGAEIKIILTPSARHFITPLTLSTLSGNEVLSDFFRDETGAWNNHVELGLWADLFLIAPASANTLGKMAHGICDNLLLGVYLSARCPVLVAPAMDSDMFQHPSTTANLQKLKDYGNQIVPPGTGELASGLHGPGRLAEPEEILKILKDHFQKKNDLKGLNVLLTAGPTREPIDPVRFIGNQSTGKMGIALAKELSHRGATVHLVYGPGTEKADLPGITTHSVNTAIEMYEACKKIYPDSSAAIFTAAVADYRPAFPSEQKIKKSGETLTLDLTKNPDIALELGKMKSENQVNVGFALETENDLENGKTKLHTKNLDFIVINSLADPGAGFAYDTNQVTILDRDGSMFKTGLKNKMEIAREVTDYLMKKLKNV